MMKTILVPLDGSSLAEQVLPQVQLLALRMDASVCLLRVVSDIEHVSMVGDTILGFHDIDEPPERYQERERRVWQIERQRAENYLAARATQLRAIGLNVTFSALLGPPPEIILETARRCHANLIAMATHGASGLRRWALGSVAEKVVQAATTPVM
jgi:nucleotide-binding universal stress UspA family protein